MAELFHLLGIVGATILACRFHGLLTIGIAPWVPIDPSVLDFLIFVALLLLGWFVGVHLAIRTLVKHVTWERLHWTVQGPGLLLGGIRGLWCSGVGLLLLLSTGQPYVAQSIEERSVLGPRLLTLTRQSLARAVNWSAGPGSDEGLIPSLNPRPR